ncbi:MAG: hypothetical protein P4K98_13615 [Bryobacteraceae bacterium]|nr:hypothetical protein [Bryobacteraceae bacterium]
MRNFDDVRYDAESDPAKQEQRHLEASAPSLPRPVGRRAVWGTAPALAQPDTAHWREFVGSTGFEVRYPRTWFRFGSGNFGLDIVSTRHRQEATIIPGGAQMISAYERRLPADDDFMADFRKSGDAGDVVLSQTTVAFFNINKNECKKSSISIYKSDVTEGVPQLGTDVYCKIGQRTFEINLVQWADVPYNQPAYEIALAMAKSLRADPARPPLKN